MTNDLRAQGERHMAALERWMAPLFAKLPHLSHDIRETIVKIAPWLALLGGILGLAGMFTAGVLTSLVLFFIHFNGGLMNTFLFLSMIIVIVSCVLDLLAYKPLSMKRKLGWNLIFYGAILSIVASAINIAFGYGSPFGLLWNVVGLWLLFEVRGMYT